MFLHLEFSLIGVHLFFICFVLSLTPDAGPGGEEVELSWEDYLEETGSTAVPYGSFKHVSSVASLFTPVFFDFLCPFRQFGVVLSWGA